MEVLEQRPCLKASSASMPLVRKHEATLLSPCHKCVCTWGLLQAIQNNESQRYRQRNKNQYSQMLQAKNANTFIPRPAYFCPKASHKVKSKR